MAGFKKNEKFDKVRVGRVGNRPFWVLNLSNVIRAIHQVGGAVFLASFLVEGMSDPPRIYIVIAFVSGGALFITEGMRHRQIFRELSGISTLTKLLLLGAAYHGYLPATATVLVVFLLASMMSHAPKFIRHRLMF